ncbi:MarR family transcriptional regulator [Catellatospora bangladeshensis]|uniref:MarR family transcriptional regulator n=1 Tax=Catellatospora bangladeshensis TaxID=310355 RepID=A0A8J3K0D3_9ACTN|nr:MarR family transcriptional regulator [Catellatospora bangladeshensis]GIF86304.1 MarR family transcriptional regulator [Catellatospora bangladeshensis]
MVTRAPRTADLGQHDLALTVQRLFAGLRRLSPPGISLSAAATLATLEREGPQRLTELAGREGVTQPAMTQIVTRLERDALAVRAADPADRRVVLVEITQAGRDLLRHRRAVRAERVGELLAGLDDADRTAITAALPALHRLAERAAATA